MISLIHQTNFLLDRQLKSLQQHFVEKGGLRERMYQARVNARKQTPNVPAIDFSKEMEMLRKLYRDISANTTLSNVDKSGLCNKLKKLADALKKREVK